MSRTILNKTALLRFQPHRSIAKDRMFSNTAITVDSAAKDINRKNRAPQSLPPAIWLNTFGRVAAAGVILIELMPGQTEETVNAIEARVRKAKSISTRILEGATAEDLIKDYLGDFELIEMDHDYPIEYSCRCSTERVKRSIGLLGLEELDSTISKAEELEVSCEFCGRRYVLSIDDLKEVRAEVYKQSLN